MVVKKAVSLLSGLGETTLFCGLNTSKKAINKLSKLMVYKTAGERFENILKSALKPHEMLNKENIMKLKENIMKLKEKLLLKDEIEEDLEKIMCPHCGLSVPSFFIFCHNCGKQLYNDIYSSVTNKSNITHSKLFTSFSDFPLFLDAVKLVFSLLEKLNKSILTLNR